MIPTVISVLGVFKPCQQTDRCSSSSCLLSH